MISKLKDNPKHHVSQEEKTQLNNSNYKHLSIQNFLHSLPIDPFIISDEYEFLLIYLSHHLI
jgi:hypothetical protein